MLLWKVYTKLLRWNVIAWDTLINYCSLPWHNPYTHTCETSEFEVEVLSWLGECLSPKRIAYKMLHIVLYRIAVAVFVISSVLSTSAIPPVVTVTVVVAAVAVYVVMPFYRSRSNRMMQILMFSLRRHSREVTSQLFRALPPHIHIHQLTHLLHIRDANNDTRHFHVFYYKFQIPSINFMTLIGLINSTNSFKRKCCLYAERKRLWAVLVCVRIYVNGALQKVDTMRGMRAYQLFDIYEFINKLFAGIL